MRGMVLGILLFMAGHALAQRMEIRPVDLRPLISLPWKDDTPASLQENLNRIYLESDRNIRYPVVAAFVRQIAVKDLETAFDFCLRLEGTQNPHRFVAFFVRIWAERDPKGAWKRIEPLFSLQNTDWLSHDSWSGTKITFRYIEVMRKSTIWMDPSCLAPFVSGLKESSLSPAEKARLRKAFMAKWSVVNGSLPGDNVTGDMDAYRYETPRLIEAFRVTREELDGYIYEAVQAKDKSALQVLMRRWLAWEPEKAFLVVSMAEKLEAASDELFLLWLQLSPLSLVEWVDKHQDLRLCPVSILGMLMSHVAPGVRQRWIKGVRQAGSDANDDLALADLCRAWGAWDFDGAMQAAIVAKDVEAISAAPQGAIYGFQGISHHGLNAVRDFDLARLPQKNRRAMFDDWYVLMEQWGYVDIGEAARYGLHFMLKTDYTPREDLIKLFSGDNAFGGDADMIDRTFCAMRMWAVLQPEAMKAWIGSQPDAEMREALTWLMENPWGTGAVE